VDAIRIKWPTGQVEALGDIKGKAKADAAKKRAAALCGRAAEAKPLSEDFHSLLRDAADQRKLAAAHMASQATAKAQASAIKRMTIPASLRVK
jgi:hypothetical protein